MHFFFFFGGGGWFDVMSLFWDYAGMLQLFGSPHVSTTRLQYVANPKPYTLETCEP